MPLMMGNEAYSGFERSLAVCEIDETLIGMAKERFAEYLKKGVIKDSRFGDDSWDTYDEIRNCCLDFSFDKKAFAGNTQDWIGCTAKCYSDCLRTYVLMKFGELSLLRLQKVLNSIREIAGLSPEDMTEYGNENTELKKHIVDFLGLIPQSNELRESVMEDLEEAALRKKLSDSRDLSAFRYFLDFGRHMEEFWNAADAHERYFYFPVWFWWNLTSILPLRATEYLMTPRDCIITEDDKTFIQIRRTLNKKRGRKHGYKINEDYKICTYEIPEDIAEEIRKYIKATADMPATFLETLLIPDRPVSCGYFSYGQMVLRLKKLCDHMMNDENYPIHLGDTRHLAMINLILSGGSPTICRELAGHESIDISSGYYANLSSVVEGMVFNEFHGGREKSALKEGRYYIAVPEGSVKVHEGWCSSPRMIRGDVGDCIGAYIPDGEIGDCRTCRYFYPEKRGLQLDISKRAKEDVDAGGIYLMQMIELVRKSLGCEEDIASAILRIRGSADRYGKLLARRLKEEQ